MTTCPIDQSFNRHDAIVCDEQAREEAVDAIAENLLNSLPEWAVVIIDSTPDAYSKLVKHAEKMLDDRAGDVDSWEDFEDGE